MLSTAIAWVPLVCSSADFAPPGTVGTLTLKVRAEGRAKHKAPPRAGLDAREWKVNNTAQISIRLRAMDPTGDASAENQYPASAARDAFSQSITEKDQEILDKWEDKTDACNGDQACESRVMAQMMADPQYRRIMQKMQGAAPAVAAAARAVETGQAMQVWTSDASDPSPASGSLQIDLHETAYGVVDTGGGGKVDVRCRWNGDTNIAAGSPESKVGASLLVDAKRSRYEIRLPADAFGARLPERCADSKGGDQGPSKNTRHVRLIGEAPAKGAKDFAQILTLEGPLGSARSPQIGGKHVVTTELLRGNSGEPVPVKVTIEWRFAAGGR
ncbi:MAG: hypothetical protein M5U08_22305 [Burkholderiales bacterium]|nr:hypothetical protein [Burkholderiales bacterium]